MGKLNQFNFTTEEKKLVPSKEENYKWEIKKKKMAEEKSHRRHLWKDFPIKCVKHTFRTGPFRRKVTPKNGRLEESPDTAATPAPRATPSSPPGPASAAIPPVQKAAAAAAAPPPVAKPRNRPSSSREAGLAASGRSAVGLASLLSWPPERRLGGGRLLSLPFPFPGGLSRVGNLRLHLSGRPHPASWPDAAWCGVSPSAAVPIREVARLAASSLPADAERRLSVALGLAFLLFRRALSAACHASARALAPAAADALMDEANDDVSWVVMLAVVAGGAAAFGSLLMASLRREEERFELWWAHLGRAATWLALLVALVVGIWQGMVESESARKGALMRSIKRSTITEPSPAWVAFLCSVATISTVGYLINRSSRSRRHHFPDHLHARRIVVHVAQRR